MKVKLIILFAIAFLIRLIALSQSLWLDETTSANVVKNFNYLEIVTKFSPTDFHPPLYYLFLKFWSNLFGYSEIALRMPSVIFSLLTGLMVYKIGKSIKDDSVGIMAAVFFLFNPLIVYYSQEARMYMIVTFTLTTAFYYFIFILKGRRDIQISQVQNSKFKVKNYNEKFKINFVLLNIFLILSFYTFYGSIFFIASLFVYLLIIKKYRLFLTSFLIFNFALFTITPLLYQQFLHAKAALQLIPNWHTVLGAANIKNLLLIPLKFTIGRISFYPKAVYYLISGFWAIGIIWIIIKGAMKQKMLFFILGFPLILGLIFSFFTPLLQYFRFIYLIPSMSILLAFGISNNFRSYIIASGFLIFSLIYLLNPVFHREDWKSLVKDLPKNQKIYSTISSFEPLKYYSGNLNLIDMGSMREKIIDEKDIIIIPYAADIYGIDYKSILIQNDFKLIEKKTYRGLTFEEWIKF